jgi:hypothetical protein
MPDAITPDPTPEVEGLPATESGEATPKPEALTPEQKQVEAYRKRQAGSDAARAVAESQLAAQNAELEAFRAASRTAAEKDLTAQGALEARAVAAEKRATEAEAKATGRVLDARFPNARKELPEITDEVRLAKYEALLSDEEVVTTKPTPRGNNGQRDTTGEAAGGTQKPGTVADAVADLRRLVPTKTW